MFNELKKFVLRGSVDNAVDGFFEDEIEATRAALATSRLIQL